MTLGWRRAWALGVLLVVGCSDRETVYRAGALEISPRSIDFGPTAIGEPKAQRVTLFNAGRAPVQVYAVRGDAAELTVEGGTAFVLPGGTRREVTIRFGPAREGRWEGALHLESDTDREGVTTLPLLGRGVRVHVEASPTTLHFGDVALREARTLAVTLRNPTEVPATVNGRILGGDADAFALTTPTVVVPAGGEASLDVRFSPARLGGALAGLELVPCRACPGVQISLVGVGVASMVEVSPPRVDFGTVPRGASATAQVQVRNLGNLPFTLRSAQVLQGSGVFVVAGTVGGGVLAPGAAATVTVVFTPANESAASAMLELSLEGSHLPANSVKVPLTGQGGPTCVTVTPRRIDFGEVPEGANGVDVVTVANRCEGEVLLSELAVRATSGGYFFNAQGATAVPLAPGASVLLELGFSPAPGTAASEGTFTFRVQGTGSTSTETVALAGRRGEFLPCRYGLRPSPLDFGNVAVGSDVTLGVALTNEGEDDCFVSGMRLVAGSDASFLARPVTSLVLAPSQSVTLRVRARPQREGPLQGQVEVHVHAATPRATVPVSANGVVGCWALEPSTADFGTTRLGCPSVVRTFKAVNRCQTPVVFDSATVGAATGDGFSVRAGGLPVEVAPGRGTELEVAYTPRTEGIHTAAVAVSAGGQSQTAGLVGRAWLDPTQTDRFFQETRPKVDVLFVVDNSGSMMEEQQSLAQNFASFLSTARDTGVDYRIAVTTTGIEPSLDAWSACPGGAEGGEAGRFFPLDGSSPRVITPSTPNASAVFSTNAKVGICHWHEQGLEAAYRALSEPLASSDNAGFLRSDAKLAIIFLSDEEDFSPQSTGFYEGFFRSLKPEPGLVSLSAIVGPEDLARCPTASSVGSRYLALARATGGVTDSICTRNWAGALQEISQHTFGSRRQFPLSQRPSDPARLEVKLNGVRLETGWTYDSGANAVVFPPQTAPPPGTTLEITYPLGC